MVAGKCVVVKTFKDRTEEYGCWLAVVHYLGDDGTSNDPNDGLVRRERSGPVGM